MLMLIDDVIVVMFHYEMKYNMLHYFTTCRCKRNRPIVGCQVSVTLLVDRYNVSR